MYVHSILRHDPQAQILYTMGQTPQWAAKNPSAPSAYRGSPGQSSAPHIEDWRNYVRVLAERYAGKIRYWELWNEPDNIGDAAKFYTGSIQELVEMARVAREELRRVDPLNVVVAPSIGNPLYFDEFMREGGREVVDIVAYHSGYGPQAEALAYGAATRRAAMTALGIGSKPLWNTEGQFRCGQPGCADADHPDETALGAPLRALLTLWGRGVSNFSYYTWEGQRDVARYLDTRLVHTTATADTCSALGESGEARHHPLCPTRLGKAYAQSVSWLAGTHVIDAYLVEGRVYVYKLHRDGVLHVVLWTLGEPEDVQLPSNWMTKLRMLHRLDGTRSALDPEVHTLRVGKAPVLLTP